MSAEMVRAKLNGKYEIILPKHRAERPDWYTEHGWERSRLDALHDVIKHQRYAFDMLKGGPHQDDAPLPVVYYVGSEEGEMPALCQMWGAEVVLFEPNPKVWPNTKAIWEANNLDAPRACFEGFASNETSDDAYDHLHTRSWPIHADEEVIGNHGFKELYLEADNYPQIRIHDAGRTLDIAPTIITFDCEGSDWEVMRGAEETLRKHKPVIFASIHPEFMFHQFGEYSRNFRDWIIGMGYEETILDYQHELHTMYVRRQAL